MLFALGGLSHRLEVRDPCLCSVGEGLFKLWVQGDLASRFPERILCLWDLVLQDKIRMFLRISGETSVGAPTESLVFKL